MELEVLEDPDLGRTAWGITINEDSVVAVFKALKDAGVDLDATPRDIYYGDEKLIAGLVAKGVKANDTLKLKRKTESYG